MHSDSNTSYLNNAWSSKSTKLCSQSKKWPSKSTSSDWLRAKISYKNWSKTWNKLKTRNHWKEKNIMREGRRCHSSFSRRRMSWRLGGRRSRLPIVCWRGQKCFVRTCSSSLTIQRCSYNKKRMISNYRPSKKQTTLNYRPWTSKTHISAGLPRRRLYTTVKQRICSR